MTQQDRQAEREQRARELMQQLGSCITRDGEWDAEHRAVGLILQYDASTEQRVLEEAAATIESWAGPLTLEACEGCGNEGDIADGAANDAHRTDAQWLRQQAKERKP